MPNGQSGVYKIAMLGDEGCGKTALLVRFLTGRYIGEYDPTIEDTYRKVFLVHDNPKSVDILDTTKTGKESIQRKHFLKQGDAFVLVYSITNRHTFEMVETYGEEINQHRDEKHSKPYKISLVGNKCDLENTRKVSKEEGQRLAAKHGWLFCEASAAENTAIRDVFFGISKVTHPCDQHCSNSDSDSSYSNEKQDKRKRLQKRSSHNAKFSLFKWHSQQ